MATRTANSDYQELPVSSAASSAQPTGHLVIQSESQTPASVITPAVVKESEMSLPSPSVLMSPEFRRWAHDVRNALNTLRLCTAAIDICDGLGEHLEMLDQIERAADKTASLMDGPPGEPSH